MSQDPFYVTKGAVEETMGEILETYEQWKSMLHNPSEEPRLNAEMQKLIRAVEWDLQDLDETIGIVQTDLTKYSLTEGELDSRRQFVDETRTKVTCIKADMQEADAKAACSSSSTSSLHPQHPVKTLTPVDLTINVASPKNYRTQLRRNRYLYCAVAAAILAVGAGVTLLIVGAIRVLGSEHLSFTAPGTLLVISGSVLTLAPFCAAQCYLRAGKRLPNGKAAHDEENPRVKLVDKNGKEKTKRKQPAAPPAARSHTPPSDSGEPAPVTSPTENGEAQKATI